jgi:hypothetical protein
VLLLSRGEVSVELPHLDAIRRARGLIEMRYALISSVRPTDSAPISKAAWESAVPS